MSKALEEYKNDIVEAARSWVNSHKGMPGYTEDWVITQRRGYLYDRVTRYEDALKASEN